MPIGAPTVWATVAVNFQKHDPVAAGARINWLNPQPLVFAPTTPWRTELPSLVCCSRLMPREFTPVVSNSMRGAFALFPDLSANSFLAGWDSADLHWGDCKVAFSLQTNIESVANLVPWRGRLTLNQQQHANQWLKTALNMGQFTSHYKSVDAIRDPHILPYGPTPSRWYCSGNYRPQIGRARIRFASTQQNDDGAVQLRFTASPVVCVYLPGGGFKVNVPSTPVIDVNLPIEPQVQRAYVMQPTLDCIRIRDNQRIIINSFSIGHSRGQFAMTISCEFSSRIDSERTKNELLKWTVNGYEFYGYIEQYSKRTIFGDETYSGSGRSRIAEIAAPYKSQISYTNMTMRSFAGILQDLLQFTDWTVELQGVTDFSVPARAFSTAGKPPVEAVNEAIGQLGCMMLCDDENQSIKVIPRWPVSPWQTAAAVPDIVVHDAVIQEQSETDQISPLYDSVFVRGEQVGVSVKVRRMATAGDTPAPDISSSLIVDVQAARLAGTAALADSGHKRNWQLTLPVMASLPPFKIGQLIGVRVGTDIFKSTCDSFSMRAAVGTDGAIDISQSVGLSEALE